MSLQFLGFRAKNDTELHEQVGAMKMLIKIHDLARFNVEGREIQVFRTHTGLVYRVLENGYGLRNKMWGYSETFPQLSYDGRSMSREDISEKDMATIIQIEDMIRSGASFLVVINEPKG